MAELEFTPGTTFTTKGDDATVKVIFATGGPLKPGIHEFQLVVVDDSGNESFASRREVLIVDQTRPNAVLTVFPSETVPFGEGFTLSGEKSFDIGGTIQEYRWTMVR